MARRRLDKTWADYVTIGLSPALIMLLIGSLMYFLLAVGYAGDYDDRLKWILNCFVLAIVLIGRISIEEGKEKAMFYGLALTGAMFLAVARFIQQPFIGWCVLGVVWWSAHKLTWDCTLIDEQEDASGEGLLQVAGLDAEADEAAGHTAIAAKEPTPADTSLWRQIFGRPRKKTSAPGVWVVYFSMAALPIFGLGQRFIPESNLEARRAVFWYMIVYVGSALALLLTTSFLGLRRYLRQRKLQMPPAMTGLWMGFGAALILLVLAVCSVLPRPSPEYAAGSFTGHLDSEQLNASQYAQLSDSATQDPSGQGKPGEGQGQQPEGQQSQSSAGQGDSQGQSSQSGGQSEGSQSEGSPSSQGEGKQPGGQQGQSGGGSGQGKTPGGEQASQGQNQPQQQQSQQQPPEQQPQESSQQQQQSKSAEQSQSSSSPSKSWMPEMSDLSSGLSTIARWVLNLVLVLAVLYVVIRYWRQLVAGFQQLFKSWRDFLAQLFGRKPSEPGEEEVAEEARQRMPAFAEFPNPFAQKVRGLTTPEEVVAYSFKALEAWAAEQGLPRQPQETPWEFADRVGESCTSVAKPVRELATLFARMNYGGQRLPATCLESVRAFWRSVESLEAPHASTTAK